MLTYYQILQVEEDASPDEIKKAYRKLSKILHPDQNNNTKESNIIFNLLHEAYETLSNQDKRKKYNPNTQKVNNIDASSSEYYNSTISRYKNVVSDYQKTVSSYRKLIKQKDDKEKELLSEIEVLKSKIKTKKAHNDELKQETIFEKEEETKVILTSKKQSNNFQILEYTIITLLIISVVLIFIFMQVYPILAFLLLVIGFFAKVFFNVFKPFNKNN